jgi:hypothetical protein
MILFSVVLLGVLAGCLVPNEWLPPLPNDKLLHFGAYGLLTLLAARIADGWTEFALWSAALVGPAGQCGRHRLRHAGHRPAAPDRRRPLLFVI